MAFVSGIDMGQTRTQFWALPQLAMPSLRANGLRADVVVVLVLRARL
jgi:hypothetical protein